MVVNCRKFPLVFEAESGYFAGMKANLPIEVDPEIMSGAPVFRGTRVPVKSRLISTPHPILSPFEAERVYSEDNLSLDEILDCFPTVRRADAIAVLEHSKSELLVHA